MVNKFFQDVVIDLYGKEKWDLIYEKSQIEVENFISMEQYPDEISYKVVGAACEVLELSAKELLTTFGEHWIKYTSEGEYKHLYKMSGDTLIEFIRNLDKLHQHVGDVMPKLKPPSFKCTDISEQSLRLHYYTDRPGLAYFVVGLVQGLGSYYKTKLEVILDKEKSENQDHDEFVIKFL